MHSEINKENKEETKPAVLYDYNLNMGAADLEHQILQPYLLEKKKGSKWHRKIFKRLLNTSTELFIIHDNILNYVKQ
jgi:hypothetical protein